jgi:serine/threonine-protein kinase RsbT
MANRGLAAAMVEDPPLTAVPIARSADIVRARQEGRSLAARVGFNGSDLTVIATAISELARNILEHAQSGEIVFGPSHDGVRLGILILARDSGPGILDVPRALRAGYSSGKGLGMGLPGVRRLMDEFEVSSRDGMGTSVQIRKWLP